MTLLDLLGLFGVGMLLVAYALTVIERLDARGATALTLNFVGASLILLSLWRDWNLSAAVMEAAWAAVALIGLLRLALVRAGRQNLTPSPSENDRPRS